MAWGLIFAAFLIVGSGAAFDAWRSSRRNRTVTDFEEVRRKMGMAFNHETTTFEFRKRDKPPFDWANDPDLA